MTEKNKTNFEARFETAVVMRSKAPLLKACLGPEERAAPLRFRLPFLLLLDEKTGKHDLEGCLRDSFPSLNAGSSWDRR